MQAFPAVDSKLGAFGLIASQLAEQIPRMGSCIFSVSRKALHGLNVALSLSRHRYARQFPQRIQHLNSQAFG